GEGRHVLPSRPERRGQDDDSGNPRRPPGPDLGGGPRARRERPDGLPQNPGPRRHPATGFRTLRPVAAAGGRRLLGPAVRPNDDEERDRRHPPDGRADGPGGYPRHEPLRRREAAARDRDVPRGTSGARLPRRADDRTRPQRTAGAVGP